jgi:hypothetical protein
LLVPGLLDQLATCGTRHRGPHCNRERHDMP